MTKRAKKFLFLLFFLKAYVIKMKYYVYKRGRMEIVVEYVLLENVLIDLMIFKTTSMVLKIKGRFLFLISLFASVVALILPIFHLGKLPLFFIKILLGILLANMAFKFSSFRSFIKVFLVFLFSTFLYGGVVAFIQQSFGEIATLIILGVVILTYFILKYLIKFLNKRKAVQNLCYDVELEVEGKRVRCKGFLDTGNLLIDPLTNRPVSIIDLNLFSKIFGQEKTIELLTKKVDVSKFTFGHFIHLDTVGKGDKVLTFEIDRMSVSGKEVVDKPMLALTYKNFSSYEMILNSSFV